MIIVTGAAGFIGSNLIMGLSDKGYRDLVNATFRAMEKEPSISFIDTPEDIRDKYQYFTQADMGKLRRTGYNRPFNSLEDGVMNYTRSYLLKEKIH
jgi:ADP-L-glycero-D-manno-heptose 6-epimerase